MIPVGLGSESKTLILTIANGIALMLLVYLALGLAVAVPFVLRGVNKIDPVSSGSSWGFRLIILPGVVALWPLLLRRWLSGAPQPSERNAHRDTASGDAA